MEVAEEDLNSWDHICELRGFKNLLLPSAALTSASSSDGLVADLIRPKSEADILAEKTETLKANLEVHLTNFHQMSIKLKIIRTKCEASPELDMMSSFVKSVSALIVKVDRVQATLNKLLTQEANMSEIPQLISMLEETEGRYTNTLEWADKFNVMPGEKKRRR